MNKKNNEINDDGSIDLIELLSNLWKSKVFIIKITLFFTLIGIIYSFSLKNSFTASSVFYPHYQNNSVVQSQGFRSLAGLAGFDLGSQTSDNIPTSLQPKIISSPQFKIEILNSKISLGKSELSYREYLLNKPPKFNLKKVLLFPISIISKIIKKNNPESLIENNEILKLSNEEYSLHKELSSIILLQLNNKEGFIQLSVIDDDPLIA